MHTAQDKDADTSIWRNLCYEAYLTLKRTNHRRSCAVPVSHHGDDRSFLNFNRPMTGARFVDNGTFGSRAAQSTIVCYVAGPQLYHLQTQDRRSDSTVHSERRICGMPIARPPVTRSAMIR